MPYAFALRMRLHLFEALPREVRILLLASATLAVLWVTAFIVLWRFLPVEGVKLHGNIDTGVDLLGTRADLLWIAATTGLFVGVNSALAAWLRHREPVAALFLLGTVPVLLVGLLGALFFVYHLNAPQ